LRGAPVSSRRWGCAARSAARTLRDLSQTGQPAREGLWQAAEDLRDDDRRTNRPRNWEDRHRALAGLTRWAIYEVAERIRRADHPDRTSAAIKPSPLDGADEIVIPAVIAPAGTNGIA